MDMLTRKNIKNGDELSILGFGCMKLPVKSGGAEEAMAIKMVHDAIDNGVNYFDTAYIYQNGKNEVLLGKALAGGYRERVKIATKLPPFIVNKLDSAIKIMATQLERLQTDHIDYYLLHMLTDKHRFDHLVSLGIVKWLEELKAKGTIGNIGFSFHGTKTDFELILKAYPWDFCQIQYNYLDENNQATKSGLLLAASLGIPVIVMEPLRGGKLATHLPDQVKKAFAHSNPDRSPAEWALRWVWNHPEVNVVLSGMNDEAQLAENIRIAGEAMPNSLSADELQVFEQVKKVLLDKIKIPCTACGYCMPCPSGVNIPSCFSSYNDKYLFRNQPARLKYMQNVGTISANPANASRCTGCGKCEIHCPQNIAIRAQLKTVSRELEGIFYKPVVAIVRKFLKVKLDS